MSDKKRTEKLLVSGTIFIFAGTALLLLTTGKFTGKELIWPFFLILPGLYLIYKAFFLAGLEVNILFGMFLSLSGTYFMLTSTLLEMDEIKRLWPLFMLFTGISLVPYGLRKKKGQRTKIFVPAAAIIILSLFFLPFSLRLFTVRFLTLAVIWWPVLLIAMGLSLVIIYIVKTYRYRIFNGKKQ